MVEDLRIESGQPLTLGHSLEQQRLQHRARRIELATVALKRIPDPRAAVPPHLLRAINRFDAQLAEIRERLTELSTTSSED